MMTTSSSRRIAVALVALGGACNSQRSSAHSSRPGDRSSEVAQTNAATTDEAQKIAAGKSLYDKYCALCHGANGVGYAADRANQLSNPSFQRTASNEFLWLAIEQGRPGTPMAAFGKNLGGPLDENGIRSLVAYVRSLGKGTRYLDLEASTVTGDPKAGRLAFAAHCAECHGEKGEGKTAVSVANAHFLATASDGYIRYAIERGRPGTPMKGFGDTLTDADINNITSFLRSLSVNVKSDSEGIQGERVPDLSQLVLNPSGDHAEFRGLRAGRYLSIAALHDAIRKRKRVVLLDARPTSDWFKSHIPGAFPAPFYDGITAIEGAIPKDGTWIVAYCACPHAASDKLVDLLRAAGYQNTAVLDEGFLAWAQHGYPATIGRK